MRRATAAVVGTLSGTALLLAAKFGAGAAYGTGATDTSQASGQTGDLGPVPQGSTTKPPRKGRPGASKKPRQNRNAPKNGLKNGLFRGTPSANPYGRIQVTIRVAGGRITGVAATHATTPVMTLQINKRAIPVLRQRTLAAQSAQLDTVSGATYTSGSFTASLQSALAAARR